MAIEPGVRLAGRAIELVDRDDGQYATFRVSRTAAGDELLELARDGVYRGASAVFEPIASRLADGGITERLTARLHRVGIVERGAYQGAEVLAVRSEEGQSMPAETEPRTPDPEPDADADADAGAAGAGRRSGSPPSMRPRSSRGWTISGPICSAGWPGSRRAAARRRRVAARALVVLRRLRGCRVRRSCRDAAPRASARRPAHDRQSRRRSAGVGE